MLGSDAEPGLISYAMNDIFSLVQLVRLMSCHYAMPQLLYLCLEF